jgi:nucleoside-diphosphate-sugar epimerase
MKILITGNRGYIGSLLTEMLKEHEIVGWDLQDDKDIIDITEEDLLGIDAVIHLAALASQPWGEIDPRETYKINTAATINLADLAKTAGVKKFIYASALSIFNIQESVYSRSKFVAESLLTRMINDDFSVVCIRLGIVFGKSPAMRYDTVVNAFAFGNEIMVKGDGSTLVPIVHIKDACKAFIKALDAGSGLYNVSLGYFTVKELAERIKKIKPESAVLHHPEVSLEEGINEMQNM